MVPFQQSSKRSDMHSKCISTREAYIGAVLAVVLVQPACRCIFATRSARRASRRRVEPLSAVATAYGLIHEVDRRAIGAES